VDIKASTDTGGGFTVGWTRPGEWLAYTVDIAAAGDYDIAVRGAYNPGSPSGHSGTYHVELDGVDVTGSLDMPNTGDWDTVYATVTKTGVALPAGEHLLRVVMDTDGTNFAVLDLNHLAITPSGSP
jgi:hypothetical protein